MKNALCRLVVIALLLVPALVAAQARIVIDPGHGGNDPGGVGTGLQEKNVVLDVGTRFKALLEADTADTAGGGKWTALMTRSTDVFVTLAGRSAYSNNQNADRFMSIHSNAFSDPSANGTETFSYATTGTAAQLRNLVQAEMVAAWGLTNRGNKTASFAVLRDTAAPAVLHELAFITNTKDAAKLGSVTERQKAALAHLRALQRHYNLTPYEPGMPPESTDGAIAGRVFDDLGPVVGASVQLDGGATVVTDTAGEFVFDTAAAGAHMLHVTAEAHEAKTVEVTVAASVRAEVDIELTRGRVGEEPEAPTEPAELGAGCSSGGGDAGLALLALFGLVMVRRYRA